ncbi:MAG TPA: DUF4340 domain-containing protein [Acetobacteraceae bacterium]|jgi:hypothetical protein
MSTRSLIILVIVGVIVLAGGWYFGPASVPGEQRSVYAGKLMFPDLAPKLQKVARIEAMHQGKTLTIARNGDHWGLTDRDGYPVQEAKLRTMLTALTELRLVEPRTSDPSQYATLGVEDPNAKGSDSNLLRALDGSGKVILALIVGHRRVRTAGNAPDQVYVRRPGDPQSWLAEGGLEVDSDPQLWLDRDIMNIDHSRIAKVSVSRGGEMLEFDRTGDKFDLAVPAQHPKLDDYKVEDVSRALELLTFEDVQRDGAAPGNALGTSVFTTTDGLTITAQVFQWPSDPLKPADQGNIAARFNVTGVDKAKPEAARLSALVNGWTYQLGSWKQKSLAPNLEDLEAPPSAKPTAAAGAAKP